MGGKKPLLTSKILFLESKADTQECFEGDFIGMLTEMVAEEKLGQAGGWRQSVPKSGRGLEQGTAETRGAGTGDRDALEMQE